MEMNRRQIIVDGPLLAGSLAKTFHRCGKSNCVCRTDATKLHGPYYRWVGTIDGKARTRTLSKEVAQECRRRIERYREVQRKIKNLLAEGLEKAPWEVKQKDG